MPRTLQLDAKDVFVIKLQNGKKSKCNLITARATARGCAKGRKLLASLPPIQRPTLKRV